MINLYKISNLEQIANEHYLAIEDYVTHRASTQNNLASLNLKIKQCFGQNYDLKKLILAKPEQLEQLSLTCKRRKCEALSFMQTLYGYFNGTKLNPYNARVLIQKLGIKVCPYCNRNYIYNVDDTKRTSEFDHFYPQAHYPFLAMSFYNLIPSCKVCNSLKNEKDLKINPYDERFDKQTHVTFSFSPKNINFYHSEKAIKSKYIFTQDKESINHDFKTIELFKLYAHHKDIVLELIQKSVMYNESYIDELMKNYEGILFRNREDLLRLITGGYVSDEDLHKRPLSKLIKDISKELKIL
jgi:hypothetical protein